MSIGQRDLSRSINRQILAFSEISVIATGTTTILGIIPYTATLDLMAVASAGLSGTPVASLSVYRSLGASGITQIPLGVTIGFVNVGTSGILGASLIPQPGITLNAADVVVMTMGGTNSSVAGIALQMVVRGLADIRNYAFLPIT